MSKDKHIIFSSMFITMQCIISCVSSESIKQNELFDIVKQLQVENLRMNTAIEVLKQDIEFLRSDNIILKTEIRSLKENGYIDRETFNAGDMAQEEEDEATMLDNHKRFLIPTSGTTKTSTEPTEPSLPTPMSTSASGSQTPKVAFSAFLNKPIEWLVPDKSYVAIFDRAISNVGGGYEPTTGLFTAPAGGTYFFISNIRSSNNFLNEIRFVLNNSTVCSWNKGSDDTGSVATVINLDIGDRVSVQYYLWRRDYSNSWYSASFSGYKI